jgi:hypothetical protein
MAGKIKGKKKLRKRNMKPPTMRSLDSSLAAEKKD